MTDPEVRLLTFIRVGVEKLSQDMEDVKQILTGNGRPEDGVVVKVAKLEQSMRTIHRLFWATLGGISTSLATVVYYFVSRG